jgi:alcohol dehydrogenase (cytochrome c)
VLAAALVVGTSLVAGCDIGRDDENDWATFGYDYDQNRHVPFDEITRANVTKLGKVWSVDFRKIDDTVPLGQQSFPLVVDGTMYITTHFNNIFALDAKAGDVKWQFKPSRTGAFKNFAVQTNRGVALCDGKVFMLTLDMRLIAVDADTGKLSKEIFVYDDVPDAKPRFGYYETAAPVCYKGKVIIGSSGAENGVRGFVTAFNASDLKAAWPSPYWTVPPEGRDWRSHGRFHGGGTSWMPVTIDADTNTMYFSTGNPSPLFFPRLRPGPNPKVNAVVALDVNSGKEKWWRQQTAPDEWGYDTAQPPQLIDAKVRGKDRKLISVATKEGTWFAYDAATGEPVYQRVKLVDRVEHPPLKPGKPVVVSPGPLGGVSYAPASYDPTTNSVINVTIESKSILIQARNAAEVDKNRVRGDLDTGAIIDFGTTPKGWHDDGGLVAVDVGTGRVRWKVRTPEPNRGGVTTTATGIGFFGGGDGVLTAFDTNTGRFLWEFQTGAQIAAGPTIYELDGKEYIAVAVGGTPTSSRGGTASRVEVFALGGSKKQGKRPKLVAP